MKFTTAASLLLPVATWASPIIETRQPADRAKFITNSLALEGPGCAGGSVSFDATNEIATVRLPNFVVQVPPVNNNRELSCIVALKARYPLGCTRGVARTELSGQRALNGGVRGTSIRSYVMSPTTGETPVEFSPDLTFNSDVSTGTWRSVSDFISYDQNITTPENQVVTITMDGRLQLQESGNSSGRLSNDEYILNISDQTRCCECFQEESVRFLDGC